MIKKWELLSDNLYKSEIVTNQCSLWALASKDKLFALSFHNDFSKIITKNEKIPFLEKVKIQLLEYFQKKRKYFTIVTELVVTDFQKDILEHLKKVEYGKTISYKELAQQSGKGANFARAVGLAMNKNPIPIIYPCHRVIGSDKKLTGFGGGLSLKKQLLELEQNFS